MNENETPEVGTFGDYIPNTHPVLAGLNAKVENLQSQLTASQDSVIRLRDKYRTQQSNLESLLKQLLDDEEIEVDVAKQIADIFDSVNLTKTIEVHYTISATATIEVPYGADEDDVASSTYVERIEFYTDFDNAEVLESDHDIDDWRVR